VVGESKVIFMISVIIPTRNRADLLSIALKSVVEQELSDVAYEVIVVDNGSTDHTAELVTGLAKKWRALRYLHEPTPGLHAGRHRGLKEANGDILVYADDDMRATPTWLEAIYENFRDRKISMVGGNNHPDFQGQVPGWLEKLWARPAMGGQGIAQLSVLSLPEGRREINPYFVWGCNFSVRKQVVLDAGGFHPDAMPRELIRFRGDGETHISKFVLKQGLGCYFDSRVSVHHAVTPERMTFDYFHGQAFKHGVSDSYARIRDSFARTSQADCSSTPAHRLLGKIREFAKSKAEKDLELRKLHRLLRQGYKEGFEYHQSAYREDREVWEWVHKKDYF